ncbi:MAG: metallophosphoesterase [Caryophanon sp.]|nr:metallophosphoesterase [Caryophanon sp.]
MRLLVLSDTHGDAHIIAQVKRMHKVDVQFHCGDSELPFDHEVLQSFERVRGNCDRDDRFLEEVVVDCGDKRVLMVHGHLHNVKSSLMSLSYRAQELGAHIVLFGHSHLYGAELIDNILFVNPGSLTAPRGGNPKTYAGIEIESATDYKVHFINEHSDIISSHLFSMKKDVSQS